MFKQVIPADIHMSNISPKYIISMYNKTNEREI